MTLLDASEKVLREAGCALDVQGLTKRIIDAGLWTPITKTPAASVAAAIYVDIKKGGKRFVKMGRGVFGLAGMSTGENEPPSLFEYAESQPHRSDSSRKDGDSGYVYILTNPSFRKDWVKIGMTERPVNIRSKELDNTAVPLPFEIYATLKTKHRRKVENLLHGMIDDFDPNRRIRKSREFFNINPETALRLLIRAAEVFDEEENISREFNKPVSGSKEKGGAGSRTMSKPQPEKLVRKGESWSGKTQLAKLIARRGGNEGAFGGILQYFVNKGSKVRRPCHPDSKWRRLLEDAGVKFDKDDFVSDWTCAKNPL